MICTQCFTDDGFDGLSGGEPAEVIAVLCREWRCPSCLAAEEAEDGAAETVSEHPGENNG